MFLLFLSRNIEERNDPGQPMVIGSGLLLNQTIEKHFVENIDGCVMKYAMFVSTIDSPAPMIKKQAKTPSSGACAHGSAGAVASLCAEATLTGDSLSNV
jgi:hypothetical protein